MVWTASCLCWRQKRVELPVQKRANPEICALAFSGEMGGWCRWPYPSNSSAVMPAVQGLGWSQSLR